MSSHKYDYLEDLNAGIQDVQEEETCEKIDFKDVDTGMPDFKIDILLSTIQEYLDTRGLSLFEKCNSWNLEKFLVVENNPKQDI